MSTEGPLQWVDEAPEGSMFVDVPPENLTLCVSDIMKLRDSLVSAERCKLRCACCGEWVQRINYLKPGRFVCGKTDCVMWSVYMSVYTGYFTVGECFSLDEVLKSWEGVEIF